MKVVFFRFIFPVEYIRIQIWNLHLSVDDGN